MCCPLWKVCWYRKLSVVYTPDIPQILGLTFEHLDSESMTLVVRNGHPLLADPLAPKNVEDYPLVPPLAGTTIRKFAAACLCSTA